MEKQNNNKGVIALLIVIIVILATLCVLFATGTISFNSNNINDNGTNENVDNNNQINNNNDNNNDNNNVLDVNSILEKINGVWGYGYYMISINKSTKQYLQGQYGTDGFISGTVININEVSSNKYELEIFSKGCTGNDCMEEREDETKTISIEVDSNRNIIINNNNEYQFITGDHSDNNTINAFFNK